MYVMEYLVDWSREFDFILSSKIKHLTYLLDCLLLTTIGVVNFCRKVIHSATMVVSEITMKCPLLVFLLIVVFPYTKTLIC